MQSTSGAKRLRAAAAPKAPSTATTATSSIPTGQRASPTLTHTKLPTVIKALVFSFLDQASHVRAQLVANEWHDLARLPTALPADVRIRTDLQALAPYACNRLPRAFRDTLERSRSGAATPITVLSLAFNVDLNSTELQYLRAAIRLLSRLRRLALSGRSSETMGSWIIPAHLPHIDATDSPSAFRTSLRTLLLSPAASVSGWNVGLASTARSMPALTRLDVSVGLMRRCWPNTAPFTIQSQWKLLTLLPHLQTLVLRGEHTVAGAVGVVVSQWSVTPVAERERDFDDRAVDELQRASIEREEAETLVNDSASLKDRGGDRRPRTAAAWSSLAELVLADFRCGTDMRPVFDLARHCPRLATLVFRDCTFSPRDEYEPRHQMIANLAAVRVECTRDCHMASGVGFARCHTTVTSVEVRSFIRATEQCTQHKASQRHTLCARVPSVDDRGGRPTTLAEAVADRSLRTAAERPLTIRYYAPDFCECEFIDEKNLLFDRHSVASPHLETD